MKSVYKVIMFTFMIFGILAVYELVAADGFNDSSRIVSNFVIAIVTSIAVVYLTPWITRVLTKKSSNAE